jgi:hypothetical protein
LPQTSRTLRQTSRSLNRPPLFFSPKSAFLGRTTALGLRQRGYRAIMRGWCPPVPHPRRDCPPQMQRSAGRGAPPRGHGFRCAICPPPAASSAAGQYFCLSNGFRRQRSLQWRRPFKAAAAGGGCPAPVTNRGIGPWAKISMSCRTRGNGPCAVRAMDASIWRVGFSRPPRCLMGAAT